MTPWNIETMHLCWFKNGPPSATLSQRPMFAFIFVVVAFQITLTWKLPVKVETCRCTWMGGWWWRRRRAWTYCRQIYLALPSWLPSPATWPRTPRDSLPWPPTASWQISPGSARLGTAWTGSASILTTRPGWTRTRVTTTSRELTSTTRRFGRTPPGCGCPTTPTADVVWVGAKSFLQFEIIINVLVSSFRFIWISMLWVCVPYKLYNSFDLKLNNMSYFHPLEVVDRRGGA